MRPGDRVGFCVSQDTDEPFQFELLRLVHGDPNPDGPGIKEWTVPHPSNGTYRAPHQTMAAGSSAVIRDIDRLGLLETWSVTARFCPTLPAAGRQAIVGRYDPDTATGWVLGIDHSGRACIVCGDGAEVVELTVRTPLQRGCWYELTACLDAAAARVTLAVEPVVTSTNSRLRRVDISREQVIGRDVPVVWRSPAPLRFAAIGNDDAPTWHFNGKLEGPALHRDDVTRPGASPSRYIVALWDMALGSEPASARNIVKDTRATGCDAELLNLPTRAVTGSRWDGTQFDFERSPAQYAAVHFHDDDVGAADWVVTVELDVPADLPSGVYAGRLTDSETEHYVVFFVRPAPGREERVAFLVPTFSYRAYANDHCAFDVPFAQMLIGHTPVLTDVDVQLDLHREFGLGLYDTHRDGSGVSLTSRARPVLNLGPKRTYWLSPSVWQFNADLHLVDWLHERGTAFDVVTDLDVHLEGADALRQYQVVLTGSHPEYASTQILDALEEHLDSGRSLMYLGANGYYWVTALDPDNPDVMEVRRWGGSQAWKARPGEYHLETTGEMGGLWRNRGRPPQQLVGVGFVAEGLDQASPYRRRVSDGESGAWVFDGVGVTVGEIFGDHGLVGGGAAGLELDIIDDELGTPPETVVLACSEAHTEAYFEALEELYFNGRGFSGPLDPRVRADLVLIPLASGGHVLSTGSIAWCGSLSHSGYDNPISRLMGNVLDRLMRPARASVPGKESEQGDLKR